MFKIRRLKFGRSTIFYYLCTGFENEAERVQKQPYRRGLHSGKRYDDDGRLLKLVIGATLQSEDAVSRSKQAPLFSGRNLVWRLFAR